MLLSGLGPGKRNGRARFPQRAARISELPVIRGGLGLWHGPQFRGMGLLTHGLQLTGRETRATSDPPSIGRCALTRPTARVELATGTNHRQDSTG